MSLELCVSRPLKKEIGMDRRTVTGAYRSAAAGIFLVVGFVNQTVAQNTFPSSGNAGVGTSSPQTPLNVNLGAGDSTYGTSAIRVGGTSNYPSLEFGIKGAYDGMITTYGNDLHLYAGNWRCNGCNASENHKMWFYTSQNGSSNWNTAKMVLDSTGYLGLGTSSPNSILELQSSTPLLTFNVSTINSFAGTNFFGAGYGTTALASSRFNGNSGEYRHEAGFSNYGGFQTFFTNGTERLRIDSSGYVGIGTAPSGYYKFEVPGVGAPGTGAKIGYVALARSGSDYDSIGYNFRPTSTTGTYNYEIGDTSSRLEFTAGGFKFKTAAQGTAGSAITYADALTISQNGNVGIGTTTPGARLEIGGGPGYGLILNAGNSGSLRWGNGAQAALSWDSGKALIYGLSGNDLSLGAGGAFDQLIIKSSGNVGIGTGSTGPSEKLEVNGNLKLIGTGNINAAGTIEASNIKAKYQDVAEWVPSSEQLAAGTVVVLDSTKSNQVISSSVSYDTRVAGVISAQPGIALGEKGDNKVLVATTGRVKVKVDASKGAIHIGDLLVTSDVPGVAMKSEAVNLSGVQFHRPGTLIGKALEPLAKGSGEILVLLSLQ